MLCQISAQWDELFNLACVTGYTLYGGLAASKRPWESVMFVSIEILREICCTRTNLKSTPYLCFRLGIGKGSESHCYISYKLIV